MPTLTFAFVLVLLAVVSGMFTFDQNNWFVTTWWWWWLCDFSHSKKTKQNKHLNIMCWRRNSFVVEYFHDQNNVYLMNGNDKNCYLSKITGSNIATAAGGRFYISCSVDENEFFFLLIEFFLFIFFNSKKRRCNQKAEIYRSI